MAMMLCIGTIPSWPVRSLGHVQCSRPTEDQVTDSAEDPVAPAATKASTGKFGLSSAFVPLVFVIIFHDIATMAGRKATKVPRHRSNASFTGSDTQ